VKKLIETDLLRLESLFSESGNVAIVTHVHPDGDALGSSFGLHHYLAGRGVKSTVIVPDAVPETLTFVLSGAPEGQPVVACDNMAEAEAVLRSADLLVCLDFPEFKRAEGMTNTLYDLSCPKVLVDHHLRPDVDAFDVVFSEEDISSASELLFWVLMGLPGVAGDATRLPADSARCLMTGMTTDTNNFANSVYATTFMMASSLLAAGVDRNKIVSDVYHHYREERFRLLGHLLADSLVITDLGVAYIIVDTDDMVKYDVREGDTEAFVNQALGIGKVRMSIFLKRQNEDVFRVSIRSKLGTSANQCAGRYFHGGGHELAAGGRLDVPADVRDGKEAATYIERVTREFLG